jgi:GAF domain-containing protein
MFELRKDGRTARDESARTELMRQRALSERFLLAALEARDASGEAISASRRATFLASASRDLALSLSDEGARETIRRRTLMRDGSWCIVDVVEMDGAVRRLPVAHPDPAKQEAAQVFADHWFPMQAGFALDKSPARVVDAKATQGLRVLRELGFGGLLVMPLVVRTAVLGAITFVTREGDAPFSPQEITLASDLADLCALALDNERLYREARELREAADVASRAKSSFLGTMSHELMTPLNAIGGYVALIEMGLRGPVSAEQLVDLARIRHNASRRGRQTAAQYHRFACRRPRRSVGRSRPHASDSSQSGDERDQVRDSARRANRFECQHNAPGRRDSRDRYRAGNSGGAVGRHLRSVRATGERSE